MSLDSEFREIYEDRARELAREHSRRGGRIPPSEHASFYEGVPVELRDDFTALSKMLEREMQQERDKAPWRK